MDEPSFIRPGEGERIREHRVLAELSHIEALELSFPADFEGVEPHTHPDHTDSFYVLEGEIEFLLQDGEWRRAGPGTFISMPPNVEHGFRPAGTPIRFLNFHTPNTGFVERLRNG
jgi:quercetin dioxygenase-like cupin family protein